MTSPLRTCWHAVTGAVRSTTFLSAFVGIFQGVICLHRKVAVKDHKLVYWVAGGIAALSVLLEKKARRGELALYVLPRAVDSWWYILVNHHLLPDIKNAEALGMERLKTELQKKGLKCSGTLQERAARLFLLKTTPVEKLPKKLLAKK